MLGGSDYGRQSSGAISHASDMDESILLRCARGVGVAVEIQNASCQDTISLKDISLKIDDGKSVNINLSLLNNCIHYTGCKIIESRMFFTESSCYL